MVKFLHIADVHLGTNQYNSPDNIRKKDFFSAFNSLIDESAIKEAVNFVLIAGDMFDKAKIDPNTLNQAIIIFQKLKNCDIPVFIIEGNHDNQWSLDTVSWLQFLGEHGYANFLKPVFIDGQVSFTELNKSNRHGSYVNYNNKIRIIGTQWFGSNTSYVIPEIVRAIKELEPYPFTILMLHAGIEGFLSGYGTLSKSSIEPLREVTNYLALGHIHKQYVYDDWVFNPGCLEPCSFPEYFEPHGALLVEIGEDLSIKYRSVNSYIQREFIRVECDITNTNSHLEALEEIKKAINQAKSKSSSKPMVEIIVDGVVNFKRSDLEIVSIKEYANDCLDPLVVVVKYFARPKEYAIGANLSTKNSRLQIEKTVIKDMLSVNNTYKEKLNELSDMVISLKNQSLEKKSPEDIYKYLENNVDLLKI